MKSWNVESNRLFCARVSLKTIGNPIPAGAKFQLQLLLSEIMAGEVR